jgi:hypothetical protein
MHMNSPRLEVEMVPRSCFYSNLRSNLSKKDWEKLRQWSIQRANARCEICGSTNFGRSLECHEIWEYVEDTQTQVLRGLVALCRECHRAKHMALARGMGWEEAAIRHLMKINRWTPSKVEVYLMEAFDLFEARSQINWKLDISWLETFDVVIPEKLDRDQE